MKNLIRNLSDRIVIKDRELTIVNAESPSDLEKKIALLGKNRKKKIEFVLLSLMEKDNNICPFHFNNASEISEIDDQIKFKAGELLNAAADDIITDYQVFNRNGNDCSGIFIFILKSKIQEYLEILDRLEITTLSILPHNLSIMDILFKSVNDDLRICILNFSQNNFISFCIVYKGKCEVFREIPNNNQEGALRNIEQTMQSANAANRNKQIDQIYYYAAAQDNEPLIKELMHKFEKPMLLITIDEKFNITKRSIFSLNFIKNYSLSIERRMYIEFGYICLLLFMIALNISLAMQIVQKEATISNLKSEYTIEDYNYAVSLQKKLNEL